MPRRNKPQKRTIQADALHHNRSVQRFINVVMRSGKKSIAQRLVYGAFEIIEKRTGGSPVEVFETAIRNATPQLEVRPRRVGGATYQVPMEIRGDRRYSLAVRWLVRAARGRGGKTMVQRLAEELIDAANYQGDAVRRRDESHRMADANKAFAHYRW